MEIFLKTKKKNTFSLRKPSKKTLFEPPSVLAKREAERKTGAYGTACKLRSSARWQAVRRRVFLKYHGLCVNRRCNNPAFAGHHIKPVSRFPELAFEESNVVPLCQECHDIIEAMNMRGEDTINLIQDWVNGWNC